MHIEFFVREQQYAACNQSVRLSIIGYSSKVSAEGHHLSIYLVDGLIAMSLDVKLDLFTGIIKTRSEFEWKLLLYALDEDEKPFEAELKIENVLVHF